MNTEAFADIHQHVLWGMDDGPNSPGQMQQLLAQDVQNGITLLCATAHACPGVRPFDFEQYRLRLREANACCAARGWDLRILPGCEILYCDSVPDHLSDGRLPSLGNSRYVLIEFQPDVPLSRIGKAAADLYRRGYQPVLAHVERYRCLVRRPGRAMAAREEYGLVYQMNCPTVLQPGSPWKRRFVEQLLGAQAIDAVATDAHDSIRRPVQMAEAYARLSREYGQDYARRLVTWGKALV